MKKILTLTTSILVVFFYVVAKKKLKRRDLEEAEFWHYEKDSTIKRGELL